MNKPWFWLLLVAMLCSTSVTLTLLLTQQDYVRDAFRIGTNPQEPTHAP